MQFTTEDKYLMKCASVSIKYEADCFPKMFQDFWWIKHIYWTKWQQ